MSVGICKKKSVECREEEKEKKGVEKERKKKKLRALVRLVHFLSIQQSFWEALADLQACGSILW